MAGVLITGATGLIGSWALRQWNRTPTPLPLGRADGDLLRPGTSTALLAHHRPDAVVHLAWCASSTPGYRDSSDNLRWLEATLELREACRAQDVRLWVTGTVVDDAQEPADAYTAAKVSLREHLDDDIRTRSVGWLRPTYVFDAESRSPAVVAHALAAAEREGVVSLQTPDVGHDFVHAGDVGRAVEVAVAHDLRGLVPIGSGRTHRVSELVEALGLRWQASDPRHLAPGHRGPHRDSPADVTRLLQTGWTPTRTEEFFAHDRHR